jgi:hypothetical protein
MWAAVALPLSFVHADLEGATASMRPDWLNRLLERLDRIEAMLGELLRQRATKEWYSIEEMARLLGKARFTVREWCRHGRIKCPTRNDGLGNHRSWGIAYEEVVHIQRRPLLPLVKTSSAI